MQESRYYNTRAIMDARRMAGAVNVTAVGEPGRQAARWQTGWQTGRQAALSVRGCHTDLIVTITVIREGPVIPNHDPAAGSRERTWCGLAGGTSRVRAECRMHQGMNHQGMKVPTERGGLDPPVPCASCGPDSREQARLVRQPVAACVTVRKVCARIC